MDVYYVGSSTRSTWSIGGDVDEDKEVWLPLTVISIMLQRDWNKMQKRSREQPLKMNGLHFTSSTLMR